MATEAEERPAGVHHYDTRGQVPWDIQNYFAQRRRIFSRYDEGIWLTDDAWFGVTPEPVARQIAEHMATAAPKSKAVMVDVFAGAGGNAIAFALSRRWKRVYAIEKDPTVLQCAKHNAKIYGVADQITWFEGDCLEILQNQLRDLAPYSVLFASPPWGGPGYRTDAIFNLSTMQPYSLQTLHAQLATFTKDMVLYLPRTSDLRQLAAIVKGDKKAVAMHYCMEGASKALCIYNGDFTFEDDNNVESEGPVTKHRVITP